MNIIFIATSRIPTERAMGTAIMKQCEGFEAGGHTVTLIVPERRGAVGEDPFAYHGVRHSFLLQRAWCIELSGKSRFAYFLRQATFFLSLTCLITRAPGDSILYGREPELIGFIPTRKQKFVELHHLYGLGRYGARLLRRMRGVITITHALKDDVVTRFGYEAERILVAPSGVEVSAFANTETKKQARERLGLPTGAKIALYIGEFDTWKGIDTFLSASQFLHSKGILPVVIGGSPDAVAKYENTYPAVRFLGRRPQSELAQNQQCADVLVIPNSGKFEISARHTSPLKVFTSMASGIPIVASKTIAVSEILNDTNAVMVPPDDAKALGTTIEKVVHSGGEYGARAEKAKEDVKKYDWSHRTESITAFLERHRLSEPAHVSNRVLTFLIVGLGVAAFQYVSFFMLFALVSLSALISSTISFVLTVLVSYFAQKHITFQSTGGKRKYGPFMGLLLVYANAGLGLLLNAGILFVGVELRDYSPYVVQAVSMGVLATYNFFIYRLILT